MSEYRAVLRRVGVVLVAVGLLDIGYMAYCIANNLNYSSSFNIFAVIAGIFLLRGNIAAVRLVTWFSAFMLAGFLGVVLILLPFLQPADLWITQFRISPTATVVSAGIGIAVIALLLWVYMQLRSPSVVQARVVVGHSASPPRLAFLVGVLLVIGLAVAMHFVMNGQSSSKAMQLAELQVGPGYKYHVAAMHWSGGHVRATVTAYNEHEIKAVQVEWEQ